MDTYEKHISDKKRQCDVIDFFTKFPFSFPFPLSYNKIYDTSDHPLFRLIVYKHLLDHIRDTPLMTSLLCNAVPSDIHERVNISLDIDIYSGGVLESEAHSHSNHISVRRHSSVSCNNFIIQ